MIRRVLISAAVLMCVCPTAKAAIYSKQLYLMAPTTALQVSAFNIPEYGYSYITPMSGSILTSQALGEASTVYFSMGANVELGQGFNLVLGTIFATINASGAQDSLISNPPPLYSAGFSLALNKENLTGVGDRLGLSVRKPFRIYSGGADVTVPSGNETGFGIDYVRPLTYKSSLSFSMSYRDDADNIAGETDGAVMMRYKLKF